MSSVEQCSPCLDAFGCLYYPRSKDCGLCPFLKEVYLLFRGWFTRRCMVIRDTAEPKELWSELAKLELTFLLACSHSECAVQQEAQHVFLW